MNNQTQGDAWRLTPPRLPWADMSRPFGAEKEAVSGLKGKPFFLTIPAILANIVAHCRSLTKGR
jgi:hypothetical protein